jgi:hypothetical protein
MFAFIGVVSDYPLQQDNRLLGFLELRQERMRPMIALPMTWIWLKWKVFVAIECRFFLFLSGHL